MLVLAGSKPFEVLRIEVMTDDIEYGEPYCWMEKRDTPKNQVSRDGVSISSLVTQFQYQYPAKND